MPKKKGAPNKSDFIREHAKLSADEIVKKAKEAGLTVTPTLVYKVKSRLNAKAKKKPAKAASAKKPAASKKAAPAAANAPKKGSASDFIRSQPRDLPAPEVVKRGAAAGLRFSQNLVYVARASKGRKPATKAPKPTVAAKAKAAPKVKAAARTGTNGSAVVVLSQLVLEHGVRRVKELLSEVESRVARVLAGG